MLQSSTKQAYSVGRAEKSGPSLPSHISIIMDGNRRWAKKRFLPASAGHKQGAKALEVLADEANKIGLKYLSVYAFSTENWKRDKTEVEDLMKLLREYLKRYFTEKHNRNLKLTVIGDRQLLDKDINQKIKEIELKTLNNKGTNLIIALNYGGKDEIVRATKKLLSQVIKTGIDINTITEQHFEKYLDTYGIPDPQLLIRTGGEMRLSNYMLWQTSYTELYFVDTLWPDFTIKSLLQAINWFNGRSRHFGG